MRYIGGGQVVLPPDTYCSMLPEPGKYICNRWGDQMTVVTNAPEAAMLLLILGFVVGYLLTRYRFRERIDNMKSQVDLTEKRLSLRDDEIEKSKRTIACLEDELGAAQQARDRFSKKVDCDGGEVVRLIVQGEL